MKLIKKTCLIGFLLATFVCVGFVLAADVIQTQESDSWDDIEVDLTKLSIRDDVLTLRFKFRNIGSEGQSLQFNYGQCYIVDEANQKKYFLLKDSDGAFLGGPKDKDWEGGRFGTVIYGGKSKGCWMKFPVPADDPQFISISIPGVFPFEGVELKQ